MDEDAIGADVSLEPQIDLSPASGMDPSRLVRSLPTVATSVYPETSSGLIAPLSVTALPRGAAEQPLVPPPGGTVNLLPPNPVSLSRPQQTPPVIPQGSIAPQVQTTPMRMAQAGPGPVSQGVSTAIPQQGSTAPGAGQGLYGTTRTMYPAANPQANNLEMLRGNLQADVDRAEAYARDPSHQVWFGETSKKMMEEANQKRLQIQQIDQALQQQKNNEMKADNAGIPKNQQTWTQDNETVTANLEKRMRTGSPAEAQNAADALTARGNKDIVTAYMPEMVANMKSKLQDGTAIKNELDSAKTDNDYNKIRNDFVSGDHPLSDTGFDIPKTRGEWNAQRAQRDDAQRRASIAVGRYEQQLNQNKNFVDTPDEKMAKLQTDNARTSTGEPIPGVKAKYFADLGVYGVEDVNGSHDLRKFNAEGNVPGTWNNFGASERKAIDEEMNAAYPKTEREKAVNLKRALTLATTDPKTNKPFPEGRINTNPNVQQVLAEGITAAARGGAGGTNGNLIKLELAKRGPVQRGLDELISAWAGGRGVLTGKEGQYLSKLTQGQMRYVIDFLKQYNDADVSGRLSGAAEHLGHIGRLDQTGLEPELQDALKAPWMRGRDTEKLYRSSIPSINTGHSRIYLDNSRAGMTVPGASRSPLPASALPGLYPELTLATPAAPGAAVPSTPGSAAVPSRIQPPALAGGGGVVAATPVAPQAPAVAPVAPQAPVVAPRPGAALPYNPRAGQYGGVQPAAPAVAPVAPAGALTPEALQAAGRARLNQPAAPAVGPRSSLSDTIGNVASNMLGISPAQAAEAPPVAAPPANFNQRFEAARPAATAAAPTVPAAAGQPATPPQVANQAVAARWPGAPAPTPVAPTVPTPQQPGGPGTARAAPPPPVVALQGTRAGGTFAQGVPSNGFPAHVVDNPTARTVYGIAGQTTQNITNNPVIANNSAIVTTSSAHSESSFHPDTLHDKKNGAYTGQGLFGHNGDRLANMQQFAGVPVTGKPGEPIPANVQTSFFVREMSQLADSDPFVARVLADPNASAEDLTKVQIRMEKPQGYKGPGTEEQASRWALRLANTRAAMNVDGHTGTPIVAPSVDVAKLPYPNGAKSPQEARANYQAGLRMTTQEAASNLQRKNELAAQATRSAANIAPAIGGAAGATLGSVVPGVGTVGGGAIGGALGGGVKNYFTGTPEQQTVPDYAKAAIFGGAEGAVGGIPGMGLGGMAARTALSGAVPAAEKLWDTGDVGEATYAGLLGAAGGALGEAVGRGLGQVGHLLWGGYSNATKAELLAASKVLAEQKPKIADATGKMVENPAYTKAAERAKQLGQDPDALAYSYNTAVKGVASGARIPPTMGEALTQRPGAVEAAKVGKQYDKIRAQINEAPKPTAANAPTFANDPTSMVGSGLVPKKFKADAETAKTTMLIGKDGVVPKTWGGVWNNQVQARSDLLNKEREAMLIQGPGRKEAQDAYRAMADKVRDQQQQIAEKLLGPDKAKVLMDHLKTMDVRYQRAMTAGGPDIVKTIAGGGEEGRAAQAAFKALVGNDPAAERMLNALVKLHQKEAKGPTTGAGVAATTAAIATAVKMAHPVVGAGIGMAKSWLMLKKFMAQKGAGDLATFDTMVAREKSPARQLRMGQTGAVLGAGALPVAGDVGSNEASAR